MGEFYLNDHEAYVLKAAPSPTASADRLLHELLHGVSQIVLAPEDRLTERQVNTLSMVLVDVLAQNYAFRTHFLQQVLAAMTPPGATEVSTAPPAASPAKCQR